MDVEEEYSPQRPTLKRLNSLTFKILKISWIIFTGPLISHLKEKNKLKTLYTAVK